MQTIAAIRTNKWTEAESILLDALRPFFHDNIVVVFHNRPENVLPPVPVIDIDNAWVKANDLAAYGDWGWRCGDYFYYALRQVRPDYDYYWMIEPDVYFHGDARDFFSSFDQVQHDLLGVTPQKFKDEDHKFIATLTDLTPYRAIFALTRFSGPALDAMLPLRRKNCKRKVKKGQPANDEFFTFSNAYAEPSLTIGDITQFAPSWFEKGYVHTNPDILLDVLQSDESLKGNVFHPVRTKESLKHALAIRMSNKTVFLRRMHETLSAMDEQDMADILQIAQQNLRDALMLQWKKARKK